jgi:hypothetical protein
MVFNISRVTSRGALAPVKRTAPTTTSASLTNSRIVDGLDINKKQLLDDKAPALGLTADVICLIILGVIRRTTFGVGIRIFFSFSRSFLDFINLHITTGSFAATKYSFE